jgi:uncharacterized protein (TIGR04255 family)
MVLNLPPANRRRLVDSPLELAVCQIRFEETLAVSDPKAILAIHGDLGGAGGPYPKIEQVKGPSFQVSVSAEGSAESRSLPQVAGWRLQAKDGSWIASVMPDFVALETSAYTTWEEDFGPRIGALLEAVERHVQPVLEERVGLRYIDKLTGLSVHQASDWTNYLVPELVGIVMHPNLGPAVNTTQQQVDLILGEDVRCTMRHGILKDETGSPSYVLDCDVHRQAARAFETEEIRATLEQFSEFALQLFHACLDTKYLARLMGTDVMPESSPLEAG